MYAKRSINVYCTILNLCMYACMFVCIYVCMYVCIYTHMLTRRNIFECICTIYYVCMYVYTVVYIYGKILWPPLGWARAGRERGWRRASPRWACACSSGHPRWTPSPGEGLETDTVMYVCMCVCMYVIMCVCMYVCMYVFMPLCLYVCMYVCMYVYMNVWGLEADTVVYVCMYVCMYEWMNIGMNNLKSIVASCRVDGSNVCMYCMYVWEYSQRANLLVSTMNSTALLTFS